MFIKAIRKLVVIFGMLGLLLTSAYAQDGKPFIHLFGELRVYFQDWLVVCEDNGRGVCRMVNIKLTNPTDHFFGNSQLTVYPGLQQPRKSAMPENVNFPFMLFFKRDMPALQGKVSIAVDGKVITELQPHESVFDYTSDRSKNKAIAIETYWLDGEVAQSVIHALPNGNRLSIRYWNNNVEKTETFSLRGVAKSLAFMENKIHGKVRH